MSEMVERVAQGLYAQTRLNLLGRVGQPEWRDLSHEQQATYRDFAHAAIEAMREPTGAMSEAGCPNEDNTGAPYCFDRSVTDEAYRSMIDTALKS